MLTHVVAQPEYKLVTMQTIPHMSDQAKNYNTYQWHGLLKHCRQMLIAASPMEEGDSRVYHGVGEKQALYPCKKVTTGFTEGGIIVCH